MTKFTGSFGYGPTAGVSASGTITLDLKVDAAAGARAGYIWDHVTGTGTVSYVLNWPGHTGFPHSGTGVASSLADIQSGAPDINTGWLNVQGAWGTDSIRFDGDPIALTDFTQASISSNGLNLDGTQIVGA